MNFWRISQLTLELTVLVANCSQVASRWTRNALRMYVNAASARPFQTLTRTQSICFLPVLVES